MAQITLPARVRKQKGKSAVRKLRQQQEVPAVFYGPKSDTVMLAIKYADLQGLINQDALENVILGLEIESDSGKEKRNVMVKEFQANPINDTYYHVDFYEISMDKEVTIDIPVHLTNTPVGVTNGGMLQHIRREITISAFADKLIDHIEVDVSGLDVGEAIHVEDIPMPEGVSTPLDGALTIAIVAAPAVSAEKEEAGAEAAEESEEAGDSTPEQKE